jgi:carbamoyl-phosphate synthase large subunit
MSKGNILVFGGSNYQLSLIKKCKKIGLFTVVIDPNPKAEALSYVDAFEVVSGQDFEETCHVVEKYDINAIITAATDKPLVMMSRVAQKYNLSFYSKETAILATNKFLMKEKFIENNIPCAQGRLIESIPEDMNFPIIVKPIDNSGSRGVIFCDDRAKAEKVLEEAKVHTTQSKLMAEEVVEGTEYSIESLHYNGRTKIIQITEKIVTPLPYFVELGHIQPGEISNEIYTKLENLMSEVSTVFGFDNCGSHNEVKIQGDKITLIEVSPRIGGDFISSLLVESSTGISMEKALIEISLGQEPNIPAPTNQASGIFFFHFKEGRLKSINNIEEILNRPEVINYKFELKLGDKTPKIKQVSDRYGYFILKADDRKKLLNLKQEIFSAIHTEIE